MTVPPLRGSTLILGASGTGKTRRTARLIRKWLSRKGTRKVIVFDFAPEVVRNGRLLGGRLTRFITIPDDVWYGVLAAHAPRTQGEDDTAMLHLARDNAKRSKKLLTTAPADPEAVFINDATIPLQAGESATLLTNYCDRADCTVMNALASAELGEDDPVSLNEQRAVEELRQWADRVETLT